MPVFVGQLSHFEQRAWLTTVQVQGFFQLLACAVALAEAHRGHPKVLEHPRAFRIEGIGAGLLEINGCLVITLLREQEAAVIVQQPRIGRPDGQGFVEILIGQFRLGLGLEYQGQCRVDVGILAVQRQGLFQWHLGLFAHALLQVPQPQLHIGNSRRVTAFTGLQRAFMSR